MGRQENLINFMDKINKIKVHNSEKHPSSKTHSEKSSTPGKIRVYTMENCPHCEIVKKFLASEGVPYEEIDIMTAEARTELTMNGVFTLTTPIIQIGSTFLTSKDIFDGETLRREKMEGVMRKDVVRH